MNGEYKSSGTDRELLSPEEILTKFSGGPQTGVFTDGSAIPNPGPGGWGFVWVEDGKIIKEMHGHDSATTNNRMELTALIEAIKALPLDKEISVFSDSELCVKTINEWARSWEKRGWKRKTGPIANLELWESGKGYLSERLWLKEEELLQSGLWSHFLL